MNTSTWYNSPRDESLQRANAHNAPVTDFHHTVNCQAKETVTWISRFFYHHPLPHDTFFLEYSKPRRAQASLLDLPLRTARASGILGHVLPSRSLVQEG